MDVNFRGNVLFTPLPLSISLELLQPNEPIVNSPKINSFLKRLGKCRTYFKSSHQQAACSDVQYITTALLGSILSPGSLSFLLAFLKLLPVIAKEQMCFLSLTFCIIYFILLFSGWGFTLWSVIQAGMLKACQWDRNWTTWSGSTFSDETFLVETEVCMSRIRSTDGRPNWITCNYTSMCSMVGWGSH